MARTVPGAAFHSHRPLALLLALFLTLGLLYDLSTPIFEKPDEPQHFYVVRELAERRGLPVQLAGQEARWQQEGSQPPLYYALAAALTFWIDTSDWERAGRANPYAVQGDPLTPGNRNVVLHDAGETFPWRGVALAVHLARLVSLLCGAASVWVTYRLAASAFPDRRAIALGAAAGQALLPQFLFVSGAVSNDALATLACGFALWQAVRVAHGADRRHDDFALGIAVGLAALSKLSGASLAVVAVAALALAERGHGRRAIERIVAVGTVAALVAGWWYVRNLALYGDPTGLNRMLAVVGTRDPAPDLWQLLDETEGLRLSFWGLFGWFSILMPDLLYRIYDALALLALAGASWALARQQAWHVLHRPAAWLLVLAIGLILVGVLRWGTLTPGLQGRLLFPALPAFVVLWSSGLCALLPRARRAPVLGALAAAMAVLAALIPVAVIAPAYAVPEQPPRLVTTPLLRFGERINLMAAAAPPASVQPGGELALNLVWQIDEPLDKDYTLYIKLYGEGDELIASTDTYPGFGMLPTTQWSPSRAVVDRYRLRVSPAARAPVLAQAVIGWYDRQGGAALPPSTAQGQRVVRPVVARIKVLPSVSPKAPSVPLQADFGGVVRLHGYDLAPAGITLYWSALRPLTEDYVVFVHAFDASGQIVAQHDAQPRNGAFPTSAWDVGALVPDLHTLSLPTNAVSLAVGMYAASGGARLPLLPAGATEVIIPLSR